MINKIWNDIERGRFSPVYLLYGTEQYLLNETKQKMIAGALQEEELDFNLSVFDLEETPIEVALEDAETFPFLGERRLVFLHNPTFLTSEKTKSKVEHNTDRLQEYLASPVDYTILVIVAPYPKLDERKKLTKTLKKRVLLEAKPLTEQELKKWVADEVKILGVSIEEAALDLLLTLTGTNLQVLANEVNKLALYGGHQVSITTEMVDKLVARSIEQNIFILVDKVISRDIGGAVQIYYDLLKQNEEPIKILAILAGQFRLIYQVKQLTSKGYGQQSIGSTLKVHSYRVKLAAGQARAFTFEQLQKIMLLLAEGDYEMKTGKRDKKLIVEMFILKLA
ncbi:DNA polymerase III subunit delta [Bacillus coahuilensis m2-6]|uniref:DNA polymerase III subunit delta n=1 Tax=Bacillus coahuilensis TaxID=408580 RepID=UPI0007503A15|nr:DNA polymerase III subunit delta [Bacillus coahuilensis]KUP07253.1 DNA polymerase III subunit delta [Bacillus coahuilensis m2-6]